jgi:general secretion pathway protein C
MRELRRGLSCPNIVTKSPRRRDVVCIATCRQASEHTELELLTLRHEGPSDPSHGLSGWRDERSRPQGLPHNVCGFERSIPGHGGCCTRGMTHSEHVRRTVHVVAVLFTLAACAALIAPAVVRLASASLFPEASAARVAPHAPAALDSAKTLAEAVLTRNMFDSQTGAMAWNEDKIPIVPPIEGKPDPDGELPLCEGDMRLVAAMVVPHDPELSFASIANQGQTQLYKPGMQVSGREVVGIREQRVFLRGASATTCQLNMFSPAHGPSEVAPERVVHTPSAEKEGAGDARITKQGEGSYRITRAMFEESMSEPGLVTAARVVPTGGGLKLMGLRRSSVLGQLGLQTGDVLQSINGHDLKNPDSALEAYGTLRQAGHFSLTLIRAGQRRSFEYTID